VAMITFSDFTTKFNGSSGPGSTKRVVLLAQIHDELLIECHVTCVDQVVDRAKDLMEKAWRLSVPLQVRVVSGKSWGDQSGHRSQRGATAM
jgi:DNA polymerase I-like protein with 3'-5' exonuclease and polymerase domains